MHATFLGVSTILLSDGETSLMTDGFFSRPPLLRSVLRPLRPDGAAVDRALTRTRTDRLAAVLVAHSHYDHAMDSRRWRSAPVRSSSVRRRRVTSPKVMGSQWTGSERSRCELP
ncbi:MBL fold metallo-hydrolase [Rhodococcus sp. 21391]|uniref:MBL fold metallo-hydrolase n=1 Tax=Rhodococcus sp. 21391 TaxID=2683591 RepID=UPI001ED8CAAD|nr:hypothetical protein [Rhodococcus sp. 21391]